MPSPPLPVAGVLLAAGRSTRMGRPKQLAPLNGQPLCRYAAQALAGVYSPLLAVVPPGEMGDGIRAALADLPFAFAVNPQPERGLASSFRVAAAHLPPGLGGAAFALADMPLVTAELHAALLAAFRASNAPVVMAAYGEGSAAVPAPPHLLRADLLPELLTLPDADHGPRRVIAAQGGAAQTLHFPAALLLDVDTPEALEPAERALKASR
ncbi:nucleotidyltransferase family protein [Deinococcus radiopugnans]|uniref:Molybdenum cofactor cytidylyltransferase n=1 Tax=Deinococcus radiopugnans ATCC 19172 TaxID=585398 RepID=A0A5C4Y9L4_9DEIO|nr:nucleotidyltransferase family protein [Deinococcus radiopugnans]MBB6016201.1 molybdenum cofactor cytidylyltransferase [Deinococcus radiopugnans ATCC 19172]TNM72220.1 nucleotidyltransferase family protein [Deinococcus radiopugnans ATCC 19172]